jgi:hypothetical protein
MLRRSSSGVADQRELDRPVVVRPSQGFPLDPMQDPNPEGADE